jgi:tetratricopeptide (TPR) repeat protein
MEDNLIYNEEDELIKYNYDIKNKFLHQLGNEYYTNQNFNWALQFYDKLLNNINDNNLLSIIYSNKSACYLNLSNYNDALFYGLLSIQYNINYSIAWGRIGWAFKKLKKHDDALKSFKIANKLNPENVNYKNEIHYYNLKKISKINIIEIFKKFKSNKYIMSKLLNKDIQYKIINNTPNLMQDYEILKLLDYILNELK